MSTPLLDLYPSLGQSLWLDNLDRRWIVSGELERWVERGIRGITSNPSIFAKSMSSSDAYDADLGAAVRAGASIEEAYWKLAVADVGMAADLLAPLYDESDAVDGYVSIEVDPTLAHNTDATIAAGRSLFETLARPNIHIKVPATEAGLPAITALISEGINVNVTLIFSLVRYAAVMEAYITGLEKLVANGGDPSRVASVASFFVSRVDATVDAKLDAIASPTALALRGHTALAQARVAYDICMKTFSGTRWDVLTAAGARIQRPLWASTSTKNPAYPATLYVDGLIGPDSVNTVPEATLEAFEQHGTLQRTVDSDPTAALTVLAEVAAHGIDLAGVTDALEADGVAAFSKSFDEVLTTLSDKADALAK